MDKTLSNHATDWREGRRLRAWELFQMGWRQKSIAEALGVTKGAVSLWVKRAKEGGVESLRHRKPPGAPSRLTPEQRARLPELLAQGPGSFGIRGENWRQFNVSYHSSCHSS